MKCIVKSLILCGIATYLDSSAMAVTIGFNPIQQATSLTGQSTYELVVSDLAGTSLGGFAIQVNFDPAVAEPVGVSYGSGLGNNPVNQFTDLSIAGQLFMSDVADAGVDLSGQGGRFVLGSFTLRGAGLGRTLLTIDASSSLSDADARTLSYSTVTGVLQVPDMGHAGSCLGLGMLGLGWLQSRRGNG